MSLITRFPGFVNSIRMYYKVAQTYTEEEAARFYWNEAMYLLRVDLSVIDKYLGGKKFYRFGPGEHLETSFDAEYSMEEYEMGLKVPYPPDVPVIARAWRRDDLYGKILAGDPGVLAEVQLCSVAWFMHRIDSIITACDHGPIRWQRMISERSDRSLSWPGYFREGASWTEDA